MKFLTFDTALNKTYISLFEDEKEVNSITIESTEDKYHSAYLIQNIVDLLKSNKIKMQDINVIGVNIGPGSFTGIRACLTIARVIAQQLNLPLIGISSLEILSKINDTELPVIITMDARKGMAYYAEFDKNGNCLQEPHLELIENLNLNSDTHKIITDKYMSEFLNNQNINNTCYIDKNYNLAKYLGQLTVKKFNKNANYHWAQVKPLYLQSPSITISKKSIL